MAELTRKQIQELWDDYRVSVKASTPVDNNETKSEQLARIEMLEADDEAWFAFYFPKYCYAPPADFHIAATQRVMNNPEWYEVRSWSRELSKSTRTMMELLKLALTGKKRYAMLISNNKDNAEVLLEPYRVELDSNQRIINDYGTQERIGKWTMGDFTTKKGVKFKAVGAGQSPRGTRNEEVRPDAILFDDMDTDEDCRNEEIIKKRWKWIENAAIGTRSISKDTLILFLGNIIAPDCCVVRAQEFADYVDIVNIRDEHGKSTWPQKNTEEHIDRVLSQKSYSSQQQEYYNNPVIEGSIFTEMHYKLMRPLNEYGFLVCYNDLSYKDSKKNDYKASVLMGKWKDEYHIVKCFLAQCTTSKFAEGMAGIEKFVAGKVPVFYVAEELFLLDIISKEVQSNLKKLGSKIYITPDTRSKGDKITRIEAALEPLNRNGKLFLNMAERDNPSMRVLDGQFLALAYGARRNHDDGPDAAEGAKFIIDQKHVTAAGTHYGKTKNLRNNKRY